MVPSSRKGGTGSCFSCVGVTVPESQSLRETEVGTETPQPLGSPLSTRVPVPVPASPKDFGLGTPLGLFICRYLLERTAGSVSKVGDSIASWRSRVLGLPSLLVQLFCFSQTSAVDGARQRDPQRSRHSGTRPPQRQP